MIKDHPYADGCKRIAASLFLEFLDKNGVLFKNGIKTEFSKFEKYKDAITHGGWTEIKKYGKICIRNDGVKSELTELVE